LLLSWCGFLFYYGISAGELYKTEGLRAIIASECLRDGNWIVPTLYGQPLLTKPPGMYISIALASWPFGSISEVTARLPSALAATITVFLFYWYFSRQVGRLGGLIAAAILPTSVFWLDKAPSADIDMLQVAWGSAAILLFLRGLERTEYRVPSTEEGDQASLQLRPSVLDSQTSVECWWLASLLCVAGGVLTKWTAPVFFYATIVPLLWWRGQLRLLFSRQHLLSATLSAAICLGWVAWAAAITGWDAFWVAVSREALQHLSPGHHHDTILQMGANHHHRLNYWADALTFPFIILGMTLPWSAFALVAIRPTFYRNLDERGQRLLQALHCWTWPNLLIWSLLPDPSARHAAPLLPGISGLGALVWLTWLAPRIRSDATSGGQDSNPGPSVKIGILTHRRLAGVLVGMLGIWLVAKIIFVHWVVPERMADRQPRCRGEQIAACVPAGNPLYVFRFKDEGIMFYYGRPVRRLTCPEHLPSPRERAYCMVMESEWLEWPASHPAEEILRLRDQQGASILLIRCERRGVSPTCSR
jgi:4-amino-4-deoxy-L-arabinose transferase-like glycosyltransferase